MIPTQWYLIGGIFLGVFLTLLVMLPLTVWAGWPRKRERELEQKLQEAQAELDSIKSEVTR